MTNDETTPAPEETPAENASAPEVPAESEEKPAE